MGEYKLLTAKIDTLLKTSSKDSSQLESSEYEKVEANTELKVEIFKEIENQHLEIKYNGKKYFVFKPHWSIADIEPNHSVNKDQQFGIGGAYIPKQLGTFSGRKMTLPTGKVVFADQEIKPGIPLTWGEVTKNCTRIPESAAIVKNIEHMAEVFGKVRSKFGNPIRITSGYRPPHVNRAVGGSSRSLHMQGLALDIIPVSGSLNTLYDICKSIPEIKGIGDARRRMGFIHIDCRNGSRVYFGY